MIVRADSAFYNRDVLATASWHGARFSVTSRQDPSVRKAIEAISDDAWTPICYPNEVACRWVWRSGRVTCLMI